MRLYHYPPKNEFEDWFAWFPVLAWDSKKKILVTTWLETVSRRWDSSCGVEFASWDYLIK